MTCKECNSELKEFNFPNYIVYACINWRCNLHRERQGCIRVAPLPVPKEKKSHPSVPSYLRSNIEKELARKHRNYRLLVDAGVSPKVACRNMSDKRTREILEKV